MQKYKFFCDLEFTNSDPMRGQILEAALVVTDNSLSPINHFHALVRPEIINEITWQMAAQAVHGITPEQSMRHPYSRSEFCLNLLYFLKPYYEETKEPQEFVCHSIVNKFFDKKSGSFSTPYVDYFMLEWAMRYSNYYYSMIKIIDKSNMKSTIQMAKDAGFSAINPATNRKSHKLNLLCEKLGYPLDHHKAMSDVYGCMAIYKHCMKSDLVR